MRALTYVYAVALALLFVALRACGGPMRPVFAQADETAQLASALRQHFALPMYREAGTVRVVYVAHCRRAPGESCEERAYRYASLFVERGHAHGVDPWVLAAMGVRESGLNPEALGAAREFGIMQLHPSSEWGRRVARLCRREPALCDRASVNEAAALLRRSIETCGGDLGRALGRYNAGRCGETDYTTRVLQHLADLRAAAGTS